ncbi:hypothetical protein [Streptomyces sp. TBY4]|uniref:hypothetical protein n=1 Tax=Streptomyces sp. TBY4 TaxID=2962030 RepID=UPI0020B68DA2|nr:hypothetical protein [Streptomyces sp. TBY4]MCP3760016.1 hypothetical protein [Streptomyces sp. TBY4]
MGVTAGDRQDIGTGRINGREALRPLIRSGGVGALLGGLSTLLALLPWDYLGGLCQGWGCLARFILMVLVVVPVVAALLGWGVLRLVGVRPAWRVAVVGTLLGVLAVYLFSRAGGAGVWGVHASPLLLAVTYAAAAAVTLPGIGSPRRWWALAAVLVLLWPVTGAIADRQVSNYREQQLEASLVPLLAPKLNGYRLYFADANTFSGTFGYLILPSSVPTSALDREARGIRVTVGRQLPGFAPPDACVVKSGSAEESTGPCEQVATDTWRAATYNSVRYIARREGVIVVLTGGGPTVSDGDLRAMAQSLAVRRTGFFLTG